ncbi:immunoglobulin-binding protein 1b [Clonorchis sinensis]|uniref:Immunoglobulin-binding protein 1b n=1 Tax=Clonorchis sinensis TaxID=79923 RepID=G7YB39_CLOSI|nr:immunoglobulin-binding protein 1b [Clonorchis sinensis]
MTFTNNSTFMPRRPSRGAISRVALLAAYSRAGVRKTRTPRLAIEKLVDPEVKRNYQNQLVECLPDGTVSDINDHWEKISKALLKVGTSVCGTTQPTSFKHWISDRTVSLLETRRQIPPGRHHNSTRRIIRRQVKLSVRANREAWWTRKAEEMEDAKNAGNVRRLFHLIRSTGPRKPLVSETIRDQNGSLICNKAERLPRWAQYFEQQFSWPPATSNPESWPSTESWTVNMESPSVSEVSECISLLKRHHFAIGADAKFHSTSNNPPGWFLRPLGTFLRDSRSTDVLSDDVMAQLLGRKFTDQKVRGSNRTSASRLPLSRLGQPGSIPALVLPSGGMAVRHRKARDRKSVAAEGLFFLLPQIARLIQYEPASTIPGCICSSFPLHSDTLNRRTLPELLTIDNVKSSFQIKKDSQRGMFESNATQELLSEEQYGRCNLSEGPPFYRLIGLLVCTMNDLPTLFPSLLKIYQEVTSFSGSHSSDEFNAKIKRACSLCEKAVDLVNSLQLFSKNENVDDLTSTEIRYLIIPALYGYFLSQRNDERLQNIRTAMVYDTVYFIFELEVDLVFRLFGCNTFRYPVTVAPEESTGAETLSGCPNLERSNRDARIWFDA